MDYYENTTSSAMRTTNLTVVTLVSNLKEIEYKIDLKIKGGPLMWQFPPFCVFESISNFTKFRYVCASLGKAIKFNQNY